MRALQPTSLAETLATGAKASLTAVPSRAHQREANTTALLSRGHHVHVVSNQPKKGISNDPILSTVLTLSKALKTHRGRKASGLFPNSRSDARFLPMRCVRQRVCSSPHGQTRVIPRHVPTCKSARVQLLQDQPSQYRAVPVVHHLNRLSKSRSSAGFKTSWKDLTCEAKALSPDDKIHD